jgi:hypothetical protein
LYYALAVRHPLVGNPPIPVAEMVTNDHSALNIRGFLEKVKRDGGKVFNGKLDAVIEFAYSGEESESEVRNTVFKKL